MTDELENTEIKKNSHGGARKGSGRKPFEPTDMERKHVERMSGFGMPHEQICLLVRDGISPDSLTRYFANELRLGKAKANLEMSASLYQRAKTSDTLAIFWAKTQMGWSEKTRIEHTSPDGSMSPRMLTDEQLMKIAGIK